MDYVLHEKESLRKNESLIRAQKYIKSHQR